MSLMVDVTTDQPPLPGRLAVQNLASKEMVSLAEELVAYHQRFAPLFYRQEQREWAAVYLRGLLTADVPRKNVEAMALRLLGVGPHAERQVRALQQFIGEGRWDDQAILAEHQRLVNETLGEEDGVLNTLGSDFPKHGEHSAGVAPQWCGNTGKKDNCQAGVAPSLCQPQGRDLARSTAVPA
jgi:SRSO17 transposase